MNIIKPEQIEAVCVELRLGCSLRTACTRVGVNVSALRWTRVGDPKVSRIVDEARAYGLLERAKWAREKANKLEAQARSICPWRYYDVV